MKTAFLTILPLLLSAALTAQTSIAGAWSCPLDQSQGYDSETITLTEDGYYYSVLRFLNGDAYGIAPQIHVGMYEFDGTTLNLYDLEHDSQSSFPVRALNSRGFQLYNEALGQHFQYHRQGRAALDQSQRNLILSWENYRKLGGTWQSSASTIKVIPSLGLLIIRLPNDPDFFRWGHYALTGNELSIKDISAEQAVFYTGNIRQFNREDFTIVSQGEAERFRYQGGLELDATEKRMVTEYMKMNHRLSMTTIDGIDGVQDFIWKRVEERKW